MTLAHAPSSQLYTAFSLCSHTLHHSPSHPHTSLSHPPPFTLTSSLFTSHPPPFTLTSSHPHTSLSHPPPFTLISSHPHTLHSHTLHPHILTSSHTSLSHPPPSHTHAVSTFLSFLVEYAPVAASAASASMSSEHCSSTLHTGLE